MTGRWHWDCLLSFLVVFPLLSSYKAQPGEAVFTLRTPEGTQQWHTYTHKLVNQLNSNTSTLFSISSLLQVSYAHWGCQSHGMLAWKSRHTSAPPPL